MLSFKVNTITKKLTRMNIIVSGSALLLACTAFIGYDLLSFREALAYNLSISAQVAGSNSVSALAFHDTDSAESTLSALKASPNIISAGIFTPDGQPFAEYRRDANGKAPALPLIPPGEIEAQRIAGGSIVLVRSIMFQNRPVGIVYIESDLNRVNNRLKKYVWIAATVMVVSLLVALGLSSVLRRSISEPITNLAEVAQAVSRDKDFSVRMPPAPHHDELVLLVDSFNEMLGQIQARDMALHLAHGELENRVQERTAQLAAANNELEAFSYSVSHDLRAPLRTIDGFSQALLEDCTDMLDVRGKQHFERIRAATQRMGLLIDDLLKLSKVTRAEVCREKLDLSAMARTIAAELQQIQPGRCAAFQIEDGLEATGDARLVRIVLENLLGNAWKYSSKHASARIEVGRTQVNGGSAFFVRDDGAGFDPAYAGRLFGAFQRLHGSSEFPGTGIGLATAHRILQRHGGRVWAESAIEKGATFYFTLESNRPEEEKSL